MLKAKGCIAAVLYWADEEGALAEWSSFAYIPLAPGGQGTFCFQGNRALPPEATHILARAVRPDFCTWEEALFSLPFGYAGNREDNQKRRKLTIMSDLHLAKDPGRIRRALKRGEDSDALLLAGDLVNDGLPEQYRLLQRCLEELPADLPVLAVNGNHDLPLKPVPRTGQETDYGDFLQWLNQRADLQRLGWRQDDSGAYSVNLGPVEIIGLNAVTHYRRFTALKGRQLRFLEKRLEETKNTRVWRLILCHAPLLTHNPQRKPGDEPYLSRDGELEKILEGQKQILFISGHTHLSPNISEGCVEYEEKSRRLYLNDGSVCPTGMKAEKRTGWAESLIPGDWVDGVYWELLLPEGGEGRLELCARSVHTGLRYPRGYYCCE